AKHQQRKGEPPDNHFRQGNTLPQRRELPWKRRKYQVEQAHRDNCQRALSCSHVDVFHKTRAGSSLVLTARLNLLQVGVTFKLCSRTLQHTKPGESKSDDADGDKAMEKSLGAQRFHAEDETTGNGGAHHVEDVEAQAEQPHQTTDQYHDIEGR